MQSTDRYYLIFDTVINLEICLVQGVHPYQDIIIGIRPSEGILLEPSLHCLLGHLHWVVFRQLPRQILHNIIWIIFPRVIDPSTSKAVHFASKGILPWCCQYGQTRYREDDLMLPESFRCKSRSLFNGDEENIAVVEPSLGEKIVLLSCLLCSFGQDFILLDSQAVVEKADIVCN